MLPKDFIEKHKVKLDEIETKLCEEALQLMVKSVDVHHNETHVYRMLDYLDEFLDTEEYKKAAKNIDLKILFISILWHDAWKSERDPGNILVLLWDSLREGIGASLKFQKSAKLAGLDSVGIKKIGYIIRKHSLIQLMPAKGWEAHILSDVDALDGLNLDRIRLIEKKYLGERPVTLTNLRLARFSVKLFAKNKSDRSFFSGWAKEKYVGMREKFLKKAEVELNEYENLVNLKREGDQVGFERYLGFMREKYLVRQENDSQEDTL